MTTKPQSTETLEPCPLCDKPLTQLTNGLAYCHNFKKDFSSIDDWKTGSCLMAQHNVQLPTHVWQVLRARISPASAAPVVDKQVIEIVAAMAESSLWNANGYRQALADTLEKLRELRGPITSIEDGLRDLLNSYTQPCSDDCNHSQCPLLRALHALQIKTTLERARQTVKPIVDREREGERVTSDIMNMRLRDVAATAAPQNSC